MLASVHVDRLLIFEVMASLREANSKVIRTGFFNVIIGNDTLFMICTRNANIIALGVSFLQSSTSLSFPSQQQTQLNSLRKGRKR